MDLARRISFELHACSAKWFDLSHAYGAVLSGQIKSKAFRASQPFDDMNCSSVYLAIHSILSEMSSLRDYLAEFVAQPFSPATYRTTPTRRCPPWPKHCGSGLTSCIRPPAT